MKNPPGRPYIRPTPIAATLPQPSSDDDTQNYRQRLGGLDWIGARFGSSNCAANSNIDELFLCEGQGATNNSFLGDCRVDTADDAKSRLTPWSGTNTHYLLVNELN